MHLYELKGHLWSNVHRFKVALPSLGVFALCSKSFPFNKIFISFLLAVVFCSLLSWKRSPVKNNVRCDSIVFEKPHAMHGVVNISEGVNK